MNSIPAPAAVCRVFAVLLSMSGVGCLAGESWDGRFFQPLLNQTSYSIETLASDGDGGVLI
ncbi:MAG TPA: hypothetical protein VMS21_16210, partial [Methylomirabilota bacterium]|nr:hypothetical protein [Methylomirabilota bacterium]